MRSFLFSVTLTFLLNTVSAQSSTVIMQRCLGDSSNTILYCTTKTNDGGHISGGWVTANNGDVSGYKGGAKDGWVVKVNPLGGIEWQRCIGGSKTDIVYDIIQASDGGYFVSGSTSSFDGDISSTHSNTGKVADDAFITKLNASGQVEWTRCYGGSENDVFKKILPTPDGGFICAGSSESNDGDVSGHHPASPLQDYNPASDVWVAKINSSGTIDWQKSIGGGFLDQANDIVPTPDGNYIVAANGLGYETTDVDSYHGGGDVWLIKMSPSGDELWGKAYGGSQDEHNTTIVPATDGGFVVAFLTYSNDGICSSNHSAGPGITDIGLMKIADDGSVVWTKCYGGGAYEWFGNLGYNDDRRGGLVVSPDGGYVLCGSTESVTGQVTGLHGDTWEGSIGDNYSRVYMGNDDIWVAKVNQSGTLQWQKCLGGSLADFGQSIVPSTDATEFLVSGYVISNDGDISGNKITQASNGYEGWIATIKAGNVITGIVFRDNNSNGIKDAGEPLVTGAIVTSSKSNFSAASATLNGWFTNVTDTGQFNTTVNYSPYYTAVPPSITTPYHSNYYSYDTISFALQPIPGKTDLVVNAFTPSFIRLGKEMEYMIMVRNTGTVNIVSGVLKFIKDHRLDYQSSAPNISDITADTLSWNFTNLNAGDTLSFLVSLTVQTPPVANLGDTLSSVFSVTPIVNDQTPGNDTAITKDMIIGAFDPNDKVEVHGGVIPSSFAVSGGYLQYTIRFQNTGNDTAFHVILRDTLDSKLDWSTVQMISSSHPVHFTVASSNQLEWSFENINLVDSNTNEPLSHGYVVYQVKPSSDVTVNDIIHNDASIYFDYNLPVLTNDATTIIKDNFVVLPTKLTRFTGNRQGGLIQLQWQITDMEAVKLFEIERSIDGRSYNKVGRKEASRFSEYNFDDNLLGLTSNSVYYRLKVIEKNGSFYYSAVLFFKIQTSGEVFNIYPNPASRNVFICYTSEERDVISIRVIDDAGKVLTQRTESINKGQTVIELKELDKIPQGKYLIEVRDRKGIHSKWVLKQIQ